MSCSLKAKRDLEFLFLATKKSERIEMKRVLLYLWIITIGANGLSAQELRYKNRDMVLKLVENWDFKKEDWEKVDSVYKKDREIVLKAINRFLCIIDDIDPSLQQDKEIVLASLKKSGCGIEFADKNMTDNKELMLRVINEKPIAFDFISDRLKKDKDIVLKYLAVAPYRGYYLEEVIVNIDQNLLKDKKFIEEALKEDIELLPYVDENITNDSAFIEYLMKKQVMDLLMPQKSKKIIKN